jgi:hypothetical protein
MSIISRIALLERAYSSGDCHACFWPTPIVIDQTDEAGGPAANPPPAPCHVCGRTPRIIRIVDDEGDEEEEDES